MKVNVTIVIEIDVNSAFFLLLRIQFFPTVYLNLLCQSKAKQCKEKKILTAKAILNAPKMHERNMDPKW